MAASADFFGQRNPQAVLKHGVLTRYAHYFAGRAGLATGGRVAFIDGYAGEGRYEDGSPGSPLLLASQASQAEMLGRDIKLAFVEQDSNRRALLQVSLSENQVEPDQLLGDPFEDVADDLLDRYHDRAVLLFVDPFGLGVSRDTLTRILRRSSPRQPIDVLYHFSLSTVARMGRVGITTGTTAQANASQLDIALGGVPWRTEFENALSPNEPTLAAMSVAAMFGDAIRTETGIRWSGIPVRQRPDQLPKYLLMLMSRNDKAHWDFADLASKAYVGWLHHCDTEDYNANIQDRESRGLQSLFEDPAPTLEAIEKALNETAAAYLPGHLRDLLSRRPGLRPIDDIEAIYGRLLGRARVTHLRDAVKTLHADQVLADDGTGDFWTRRLRLRS